MSFCTLIQGNTQIFFRLCFCPNKKRSFEPFLCLNLSTVPEIECIALGLSVVLYLDKGDYPDHFQIVFCPNKKRSFEPFICLNLSTVPGIGCIALP